MHKTAIGFCLYALLCAANAVAAAPRTDGGDAALRQAQAQMQRLASERSALQKENGELAAKLAELEKRVRELEAESQRRSGELGRMQNANAQLRARVERDSDRYRDLSERAGELGATLRDARADIELLRNAVQERDRWIADCQAKNEAMYQANSELLAAYRDKGAWDALAQREPLTGIASVEVERMEQEYRFRLEDLRTVGFESAAAGPATP